MNESRKWRSGRAGERVGLILPSWRGGKTPHTLTDDERIAAKHYGDVMVPSGEGPPLEVVEAKLALELFISAFCAPALLQDPNDFLLRHSSAERSEYELCRMALPFRPFHDEPHRLSVGGFGTVVVSDFYSAELEVGRHLSPRSFAPRRSPKCAAPELHAEHSCLDRLAAPTFERIEEPDLHVSFDGDTDVESEHLHGVSELGGATVGRISEHDVARDLVIHRSRDEVERELSLGFENEIRWHARLFSTRGIFGPRFRHIELEIDRDVLVPRRDREAHADLAIADFAERARVLALDADGVPTLLWEPRIVNDPHADLLLGLERFHDVGCGFASNPEVVPPTLTKEVENRALDTGAPDHVGTRSRRDGLHALSLTVAHDASSVGRKALLLLAPPQVPTNPAEHEGAKPVLHLPIRFVLHGSIVAARDADEMRARVDEEIAGTKCETNDIRLRGLHERNRMVGLNLEQ